jgi:hypothetical protein
MDFITPGGTKKSCTSKPLLQRRPSSRLPSGTSPQIIPSHVKIAGRVPYESGN